MILPKKKKKNLFLKPLIFGCIVGWEAKAKERSGPEPKGQGWDEGEVESKGPWNKDRVTPDVRRLESRPCKAALSACVLAYFWRFVST